MLLQAEIAFAYNFGDKSQEEWRKSVFSLNWDSRLADNLFHQLQEIQDPAPLIIAYKATALAHMAKSSSNLFDKLTHINKSMKLLDKAVEKRPDDLEIRFLRFAVHVQTPGIISSRDKIDKDKAYISASCKNFDWDNYEQEVANYIIRFLHDHSVI